MQPDSSESERDEFVLVDTQQKFYEASHDFRFAATVASFGMLLRGSEFTGNMTYAAVEEIASQSIGGDASGYRAEFIDLVRCLTSESGK